MVLFSSVGIRTRDFSVGSERFPDLATAPCGDCTHYIIPEIKVLFYHPVHYRLLPLRLLQTKAILNGGVTTVDLKENIDLRNS